VRRALILAGLVVGAALLLAAAGSPRGIKEGGTFRIGNPDSNIIDSIDPVLAGFPGSRAVNLASCAGLLTYPDLPFPQGLRLVPEIAAGYPTITNGGKTYTFTIRKGFRFSTGRPVTARSFAHTILRIVSPKMNARAWSDYADIVGVQAVRDGTAATVSGVIARGNTLTIRLTKPVGDFTARMAGLCVVPENLPIDPEGVRAPVAAAGPYFISEFVPGERIVLSRNRYYGGNRPHHVDRMVVSIGGDAASILERVDKGQLDHAFLDPSHYMERVVGFRAKYGINKGRFFSAPALSLRFFVLNTSRPLFRKNPRLRQAVNFAADRTAILRERGALAGYLTDQFLPPFAPGFRNERIYPLKGPDVAKAKQLAKGHTRSGKAVLYVSSSATGSLAQGQVLAANLKQIGIDVQIEAFPSPILFSRLTTPGEPFDISWLGWINFAPPGDTILNWMFDGRTIANAPNFGNLSYFNSPKYNRLLERASRLPYGAEREEAYAALDVDISRNVAPAIPISYDRAFTLVSARTGCVVVNPTLDLTAVCLK
jgi:peptide/nickel transport system substrate-binding protein